MPRLFSLYFTSFGFYFFTSFGFYIFTSIVFYIFKSFGFYIFTSFVFYFFTSLHFHIFRIFELLYFSFFPSEFPSQLSGHVLLSSTTYFTKISVKFSGFFILFKTLWGRWQCRRRPPGNLLGGNFDKKKKNKKKIKDWLRGIQQCYDCQLLKQVLKLFWDNCKLVVLSH